MLTIRLFRTGKKNQPFFKIVVIDRRKAPKSGRFVEEVGYYNPLTKEKNVKGDRIKYWISVGAVPSDTLHNLLVKEKVIEGKKVDVHKEKKEEEKGSTSTISTTKPISEQQGLTGTTTTAPEIPVEPVKEEEPVVPEEPVKEEKPKEPAVEEKPEEKPAVEKKEEVAVPEEPVKEEKTEEKTVSEEA